MHNSIHPLWIPELGAYLCVGHQHVRSGYVYDSSGHEKHCALLQERTALFDGKAPSSLPCTLEGTPRVPLSRCTHGHPLAGPWLKSQHFRHPGSASTRPRSTATHTATRSS